MGPEMLYSNATDSLSDALQEDLRPHAETHGTWECRACTRVFTLKFVGLVVTG